MIVPMGESATECLQQFLSLAGRLERPSDITLLLSWLAESAGADGIVFWKLTPGSILTHKERDGRFSPIAAWCGFKDVLPWYELPVKSITGEAWLQRDSRPYVLVESIMGDDRVSEEARMMASGQWGMNSCAAVPVTQIGEPATCITFYKRHEPLQSNALERTLPSVQQLPLLHALATDRQALEFLTKLSSRLHPMDTRA